MQRVGRAVFRSKRASVTLYSQGDAYSSTVLVQDSIVGYHTVVSCRYRDQPSATDSITHNSFVWPGLCVMISQSPVWNPVRNVFK